MEAAMKLMMTLTLMLTLSVTANAADSAGYGLSVLVGDTPRPEYHARGSVYVEAARGQDYSLRLTNPTPYRVAVALSVDGLNTIDGKHTGAAHASKWVLDAYQSTVISGWQVKGGDSFESSVPGPAWSSPQQAASAGVKGLEAGHRVVVPGLGMRTAMQAARFLPHAVKLPALLARLLRAHALEQRVRVGPLMGHG